MSGRLWIGLALVSLLAGASLAQTDEHREHPGEHPAPAQEPVPDDERRAPTKPTGPSLSDRIGALGDQPAADAPKTAPTTTDSTTTSTAESGGAAANTNSPTSSTGSYGDYNSGLSLTPKLNYNWGTEYKAGSSYSSTPCGFQRVGGWFQPVQGVYQDDPKFPTVIWDYLRAPRPNPVIEETSPGNYRADLPMIAERDTVIMGLTRFRKNGEIKFAGHWTSVEFEGTSTCSDYVPVKLRLSVVDARGQRVIYVSETIGQAPLAGAAIASRPFAVVIGAGLGLPPRDVGAFKLRGPGPYMLVADLLREDGSPTGLIVTVSGQVVVPHPPSVQFVPVVLTTGELAKDDAIAFRAFADDMAAASRRFLPDYFPLPPEGLPTFARDVLYLGDLDPHDADPAKNQDLFSARLTDRLASAAVLGGAGRVVAIIRDGGQGVSEWSKLRPADTAAFAHSTKVIFVGAAGGKPDAAGKAAPFERSAPDVQTDSMVGSTLVEVVGHELNHTLPDHLWSSDADVRHNMVRDCGLSDHNTDDHTAYGIRLNVGGIESDRWRHDGWSSLMGSTDKSSPVWITQCAYGHLVSTFLKYIDPEVMLVRAIVSRDSGTMRAELRPGYSMGGVADLEPAPTPEFGVRLAAADGRTLGSYPFDPHWRTEENLERNVVALAFRIPLSPGAARLEITHRGRVLASRDVASAPPSLSVGPVTVREGRAQLSWIATAAGGRPVLSSVLYSANGGQWFTDVAFESTASAAVVPLDAKASSHLIKVVVSDGARSAEQVVRLP